MDRQEDQFSGDAMGRLNEASRARLMDLFRYAEVGRCVNGVTHDVNNFLGVIMAYAELLMLEENLADEARRMLGDIIDGVTKCSRLINGVTTIARKDKASVSMTDVGGVVAITLDLRDYAFRSIQIAQERDIAPGLPSILADMPKLQMAVTYLLLNAQESLEASQAPKRVRVRVYAADGGVAVSVWDSGPIVPEDQRDRVFEPFFTTKTTPHLGLGLTMARHIAEMHDGSVSYSPQEGFVLFLPYENHFSLAD